MKKLLAVVLMMFVVTSFSNAQTVSENGQPFKAPHISGRLDSISCKTDLGAEESFVFCSSKSIILSCLSTFFCNKEIENDKGKKDRKHTYEFE